MRILVRVIFFFLSFVSRRRVVGGGVLVRSLVGGSFRGFKGRKVEVRCL